MHAISLLCFLLAIPCAASAGGSLLFVRGGSGTGGFLEGGSDEQLSDVENFQTFPGNHGWGELAQALEAEGFVISQLVEPATDAAASEALLAALASAPDVIILGSNNRVYTDAAVEALALYIQAGGAAFFASDANWGVNWGAASNSDQPFLARYGVTVNQDNGVYTLSRNAGDFSTPTHPVLQGVDAFDGEGVTPLTVSEDASGVTILARAKDRVRLNDTTDGSAGSLRDASPRDGSLVAIESGRGRILCHFDRNTFFNLDGAGTSLHRFDNRQLALNAFRWLAEAGNAQHGWLLE